MKKCALVMIGLVILLAAPAAAGATTGPAPLSWSWSRDMVLGSDYISDLVKQVPIIA